MTASRPHSAPKHVRWKEEETVYSFEYDDDVDDDVDTSQTSDDDSAADKIPEDADLQTEVGARIETSGSSGVYHVRRQSVQEDHRGTAFVELPKREGCGLGLVISGGADKDCTPRVSYLRPGGIAQRSDALEVGDYIISVNGIKTAYLRHDEIISLIKNAEESVILEVEYELPEPPQTTFSVICKRIEVCLQRDADTFGFTLRGGLHDDPTKCRPLTITQIRPGSVADREGTLKVGDRILSIDGVNVTQSSLAEALAILKHSEDETHLLVEYDVSVIDAVQNSQGPLLVEIDKTPGCSLGIELAATTYRGQTVLCIDQIQPASIADRCGALHVGDHILAIDDTSLEHMTVAEASQLLKSSMGELIRLEILPAVQLRGLNTDKELRPAQDSAKKDKNVPVDPDLDGVHSASATSLNSLQSFNTFTSMTTQVGSAIVPPTNIGSATNVGFSRSGTLRSSWANRYKKTNSDTSLTSTGTYASVVLPHHQVCRTETIEVMLIADHRGFGLILENGGCDTEILVDPPIVTFIEPRSAAQRCGIIQEGDRILAINDVSLENKTLEEANRMLKEAGVKVLLQVEFDVAESIIPNSGIFVVKLAKRGSGLGITINSPNNRKPGDPLLITEVKKGSVAHRTGTIQPGDRLLAIDNVRMDNCSLEDAAQVLQNSEDIVKLKIRKDETFADEPDPTTTITYTVELPKFGGPLGITISGTEEPFDPIYISSLAEGGLAEKTGALHVGDRILAINGQSLRGRPLPDAIQLLQNARDTVMLKITRPAKQKDKNGVAGKSHDSVDSALESWDSSGLDSNNMKMGPRGLEVHREGSGSSGVHSQDNQPCRPKGGGSTYCDLSNELHLEDEDHFELHSPSVSAPPSCSSDIDEWSRQLDELDHFSQAEVIQDTELESELSVKALANHLPVLKSLPSTGLSMLPKLQLDTSRASQKSSHSVNTRLSSLADEQSIHSGSGSISTRGTDEHSATSSKMSSHRVITADMHIREVEEQLQNIFTPTPVELLRVTLHRQSESESFGFGLSDGVYEKGVYISAIQPGGAADIQGNLRPYDRLLQVNDVRTKDLDCHQVVPLIARSGLKVKLVLSRNPLASTPTTTPTSSPHSTLQMSPQKLLHGQGSRDLGLANGANRRQGTQSRKEDREDEEGLVWKPQYGLQS